MLIICYLSQSTYFKGQELLTPGFPQYTTLTLNFVNYVGVTS